MADTIRHRGPSDEGYVAFTHEDDVHVYAGPDTPTSLGFPQFPDANNNVRVGFAHRRLSILDLSVGGHQPMVSVDGRIWMVFNGEIYNYLELREALILEGDCFHTESDSEVLLAGYRRYGISYLSRLRGMFAVVFLDRVERTVTLARDPFGIKPLYYTRTVAGDIAFASEVKALLQFPGVSRSIHAESVFEFLRSGMSDYGERSMFADVSQLLGGHWMRVFLDNENSVSCGCYWTLPARVTEFETMAEAATAVRAVFEESVALHMRSDVPVGACLSGGLDSTAITAVSAPMMPSGSSFQTVSFLSSDDRLTEAPFVAIAERAFPITGHHVTPTVEQLRMDLEELVYSQDFPFGSLSIYAQSEVFRRARELGLTVMLDGQGSDELFGGYTTAVSAALASRIASGHLLRAFTLASAFTPLGARAYTRTILAAFGRFVPQKIAPAFMRVVGEPLVPRWLNRHWFTERGVRVATRQQGRGRSALDDELRLSVSTLTLPQLLRYEDRNSMRFSIESRVPFCDMRLAEVAARIPTDWLVMDSGETKAVLRHATRGLVPDPIIDRQKIGFAAPDQSWLHTLSPWLLDIVREEGWRLPFIDVSAFIQEYEQALSNDRYFPPVFWRVINMVFWARIFDVRAC